MTTRSGNRGKAFTLVCSMLVLCFLAVPALAGELVVSAAASLTDALTELKTGFEKDNPGSKIVTNFAASGALLKQIEQDAPVDVFASADEKTMDQAVEKKLVDPATRVDFAANALVLILPAGSKAAVSSLLDLGKPEVARIAIGNPELVPVGRYAMQAFAGAGIADAVKSKLVTGESVRQVLDYCARGEADAAVVFATDAAIAGDKVTVALVLTGHDPITYPAAVVAASADKAGAAKFLALLAGPTGQAVLAKYGFGPAAGK